jgi:hypothetical protein
MHLDEHPETMEYKNAIKGRGAKHQILPKKESQETADGGANS